MSDIVAEDASSSRFVAWRRKREWNRVTNKNGVAFNCVVVDLITQNQVLEQLSSDIRKSNICPDLAVASNVIVDSVWLLLKVCVLRVEPDESRRFAQHSSEQI